MMKRQRRTFTQQFKNQIAETVLSKHVDMKSVSKEYQISIPLLTRWINDYIAAQKTSSSHTTAVYPNIERRRNFSTEQELKAKIAELYMHIEKMEKRGLTYVANRFPEKEV